MLVVGALCAGCESAAFFFRPRSAPPPGGQRRPLAATIGASAFPFLSDGETSRQEVRDRLGPPQSEYEGGRIVVYFVRVEARQPGAADLRVVHIGEATMSVPVLHLVLVFQADGRLARHNFVYVAASSPGARSR